MNVLKEMEQAKMLMWRLLDIFPEESDRTVHNYVWTIIKKMNVAIELKKEEEHEHATH